MHQKTVRFYEDLPEDVNALEKLNDYKKYGFTSSRAMIIDAINHYPQENSSPLGVGSMDIEKLAEHIVNKMKNMNVVINSTSSINDESICGNETSGNDYDNFQKALSFMETL